MYGIQRHIPYGVADSTVNEKRETTNKMDNVNLN